MSFLRRIIKSQRAHRVHSIAGLMVERRFEGEFEVPGGKFRFIYAPAMARLVAGKLQLSGTLRVSDSKGSTRTRTDIKALLISTQGGIGAAPPRIVPPALMSPRLEQSRTGEPSAPRPALPDIEATGENSFTGVLYFRIEPLVGRTLAVAADMSKVQLNARLYSTDERTRTLQGVYSAIAENLLGPAVDERKAGAYIGELNRMLGSA